ncbi:MAG: asparagine synthetase [Nanoarchaeota archaeon]|nr:asparagine synthetase [DPANN group archaeon]MBL7116760.1 asparagine synthetase [Nanoarchaeota archaeon]
MKKEEAKIRILGKIFRYSVDFFHKKGFVQLMPVILGKSVDPLGPDPGSSIEKIPEVEYQGDVLRLMTSMILHKQVAVKDLKKIFIMSPNIRLERPERKSTGQHLFEFTQADFEIAEAKTDDVLSLLEDYYKDLSSYLEKEASEEFSVLGLDVFGFKVPFKHYTTHELIEKYGDDDWEEKASMDEEQPFWVLSHKREFYDKEHPSKDGHYLNYDLVYPLGFCEGISGAEREHEYERLLMRIKRDKLDMDAYSQYLEFARKGFSSSAGAGIGMERLARFMTMSEHVGDVSVFKRVPGIAVEI